MQTWDYLKWHQILDNTTWWTPNLVNAQYVPLDPISQITESNFSAKADLISVPRTIEALN